MRSPCILGNFSDIGIKRVSIRHFLRRFVNRKGKSNICVTAVAARVRFQVRSCIIYGRQSGNETGFLQVILFPLPILIPPTVPHPTIAMLYRLDIESLVKYATK
jgi:hypothetical protein